MPGAVLARPAMKCLRSAWVFVALPAMATACASPPIALPSGSGAPFPEFRAAFEEAARACRGVRTWTAEIAMSGRAGGMKIRGRAFAGIERPDALRLEGLAPFGQPAFILVSRAGSATLLLPRDRRLLRHESAAAIVEALTGIAIGPDELRSVVTGCVADAEPTAGRAYGRGWHAVDLGTSATAFLRRVDGRWRVEAGMRPGLAIEYRDFQGGRPSRVRLRTGPDRDASAQATIADLTLVISQVEINVTLSDAAFTVDLPEDLAPITLEELRDAGPLAVKR